MPVCAPHRLPRQNRVPVRQHGRRIERCAPLHPRWMTFLAWPLPAGRALAGTHAAACKGLNKLRTSTVITQAPKAGANRVPTGLPSQPVGLSHNDAFVQHHTDLPVHAVELIQWGKGHQRTDTVGAYSLQAVVHGWAVSAFSAFPVSLPPRYVRSTETGQTARSG